MEHHLDVPVVAYQLISEQRLFERQLPDSGPRIEPRLLFMATGQTIHFDVVWLDRLRCVRKNPKCLFFLIMLYVSKVSGNEA